MGGWRYGQTVQGVRGHPAGRLRRFEAVHGAKAAGADYRGEDHGVLRDAAAALLLLLYGYLRSAPLSL